jgi:hypothetical protein
MQYREFENLSNRAATPVDDSFIVRDTLDSCYSFSCRVLRGFTLDLTKTAALRLDVAEKILPTAETSLANGLNSRLSIGSNVVTGAVPPITG